MNKLNLNHNKSKSETILSLLEFVKIDKIDKKEIGGAIIPTTQDNKDMLIARLKNKINYLEQELIIINKNIIE